MSTFSRAFAEFADMQILDRIHALRVTEYLGHEIFEQISYDSTAITAREKPIHKKKLDPLDTVPSLLETTPVSTDVIEAVSSAALDDQSTKTLKKGQKKKPKVKKTESPLI